MKGYNKHQIERIGNAMIYIAERVLNLNKTQLLKLLFLIEQNSVLKYQRPFFDVEFEVWKFGPVVKDIYIALSPDSCILDKYITSECDCNKTTNIKAASDFCDDEFSDCDIALMDSVIKKYGQFTASQLVEITHQKKGLWYKQAVESDLIDAFNNRYIMSSNVVIDFSKLLEGCDRQRYIDNLETASFINSYTK